jgi:hypothetical protein
MPRTAKDRERKKRLPAPSPPPVSRDFKNGTVTVSLRIPAGMLDEVDAALKHRPYKMPRHMWLLEAIHEKLMRARAPGVEG